MAGIIIEPMAERSASEEPERAAMNMLERMLAWASPPLKWPMAEREKRTMRSVMPPEFINSPARMNRGTASSAKLSSEL